MVAQYLKIKAENTDYLLFYRMGDFYEMFFDDAIAAAAALDITLTHRGRYRGQNIPMCGVPVSTLDTYLERLIRKGFKIALCEQTETPDAAKARGSKAPLERDIVRLITPGTLTEDNLLSPRAHNYLMALVDIGGEAAASWLDLSTGDVHVNAIDGNLERDTQIAALLSRVEPNELLLSAPMADARARFMQIVPHVTITILPDGADDSEAAKGVLQASYDRLPELTRVETAACGTLIDYVRRTQIDHMPHLKPPSREDAQNLMVIDAPSRNNLELTRTLGGAQKGSLLATIDMTITAAGGRMLSARLAAPLRDHTAIMLRQDALTCFYQNPELRTQLRDLLKQWPDIPRSLSRLGLNRGGPRDLQAIARGIALAQHIHAQIAVREDWPKELYSIANGFDDTLTTLANELSRMLGDELPLLAREGGFIRDGVHAKLDAVRKMRRDSRQLIANLQSAYSRETGIKSLRIKYNAMLSYYIELPSAQADKIMAPPHNAQFIHRQTMAQAVRFSTDELNKLASEISLAVTNAIAIEVELFEDARVRVCAQTPEILAVSEIFAALDVALANAELAHLRGWHPPLFFDDRRLVIEQGVHPVVAAALAAQKHDSDQHPFIANDCALFSESDMIHLMLLTGPNMAGKSTYLRQNAVIVILAQMGGYVPARSAEIGLVDRIFSRVGAADDLARGHSTFMVEMIETAAILQHATADSLVIFDEIGRGTATFDGLSLAWAIVEHLHNITQCRTLFATHYHELTALRETLSGLANYTMRVQEHDGTLVFLHEVARGMADRSYGIHVAKLAGLSDSVIARARGILTELESEHQIGAHGLPLFTHAVEPPPSPPAAIPNNDTLREALASLEPDVLSPREAHEWLYRLRAMLK